MGMTMQQPRLWLLPQRIIYAPLSRLPGEREQEEVDHYGQGDAQEDAHQHPEKAPPSHPLAAFRREGHDLGAIFVSKTTSSKTASR